MVVVGITLHEVEVFVMVVPPVVEVTVVYVVFVTVTGAFSDITVIVFVTVTMLPPA